MKSAKTTLFDKTDTPTKEHDEIMMRFIEVDEKYSCLLNRLYWLGKEAIVDRLILKGISYNHFSDSELLHSDYKERIYKYDKYDKNDIIHEISSKDRYYNRLIWTSIKVTRIEAESNEQKYFEIEYPIMQGNKTSNFYLGTIDILVGYQRNITFMIGDCEDKAFMTNQYIIEIKPKIDSISSVIRQLKVYKEYIDKENLNIGQKGSQMVILTNENEASNLYGKMLNSQNIMLINIDDFEALGKEF